MCAVVFVAGCTGAQVPPGGFAEPPGTAEPAAIAELMRLAEVTHVRDGVRAVYRFQSTGPSGRLTLRASPLGAYIAMVGGGESIEVRVGGGNFSLVTTTGDRPPAMGWVDAHALEASLDELVLPHVAPERVTDAHSRLFLRLRVTPNPSPTATSGASLHYGAGFTLRAGPTLEWLEELQDPRYAARIEDGALRFTVDARNDRQLEVSREHGFVTRVWLPDLVALELVEFTRGDPLAAADFAVPGDVAEDPEISKQLRFTLIRDFYLLRRTWLHEDRELASGSPVDSDTRARAALEALIGWFIRERVPVEASKLWKAIEAQRVLFRKHLEEADAGRTEVARKVVAAEVAENRREMDERLRLDREALRRDLTTMTREGWQLKTISPPGLEIEARAFDAAFERFIVRPLHEHFDATLGDLAK